jgi:hypothetical protein
MIRMLDGLALLKEVDEIDGVHYNSNQLRAMYPDDIVVMRHTSYIYKECLCPVARDKVTNLDNYIQLGEFTEELRAHKNLIRDRIYFMEKTGMKLFDYTIVGGIKFINIDTEFKYLFQNFQPFIANFCDSDHIVHCKLLGDIKIGFY